MTRPGRSTPGPTHIQDEDGTLHIVLTATCGQCMQSYQTLGDADGVYPDDDPRQKRPHACEALGMPA